MTLSSYFIGISGTIAVWPLLDRLKKKNHYYCIIGLLASLVVRLAI
jgi:hypothetical protein